MIKAKPVVNNIKKAFSNPDLLPARVYRFRVLGMALGGVAIAAVLFENQASLAYWLWLLCSCLIWPHLAYYVAKRSPQPFQAERRNFLFDSFIAGSWAALMWFNLLPAVLLLVTTTADKLNSGVKNLWLFSQPFMLLGILLGGLFTGFEFRLHTSMAVILACLPIMIIHIFFVGLNSYNLIRKVQSQNVRFRNLSEKDSLTQLFNRRHWQSKVNQLLSQVDSDTDLVMVLIDVDNFKQINDSYGHLLGDDVLIEIANTIAEHSPAHSFTGRLGGDEFAVVIHGDMATAKVLGDVLRQQVAAISLLHNKDLVCTVSIGLAENKGRKTSFRAWFEQADQNLYLAKRAGRNQVHGGASE